MSRRGRHGRHPHPHAGARPSRPSAAAPPRPAAPARPEPAPEPRLAPESTSLLHQDAPPVVLPPEPAHSAHEAPLAAHEPEPVHAAPVATAERLPESAGVVFADGQRGTTCTTAQLRRFIKSRPWIPMHELRRRFGIYGNDDEVNPLRVGEHTLFVGLPAAEAAMVGELLAGGDVGYELSLDPVTPVIVGVYPMRPVPRS